MNKETNNVGYEVGFPIDSLPIKKSFIENVIESINVFRSFNSSFPKNT